MFKVGDLVKFNDEWVDLDAMRPLSTVGVVVSEVDVVGASPDPQWDRVTIVCPNGGRIKVRLEQLLLVGRG
jgi:hypothetical protein